MSGYNYRGEELHDLEKHATTGDRDAVLRIVGLERQLRQIIEHMIAARQPGIDGATASTLDMDYAEALAIALGDG